MLRWRRRADEDFAEEIRANIAIDTDRLIAEGMSPEQARAAALRAFGNVTRTQEHFYESRRVMWLDDLSRDVRYALRTLVKDPSFTVMAVLALALGVGANTAIFSVVNAVLLRPLRAPDAERLVRFAETYQGTPSWAVGLRTFNTWQQQADAFEDVSAHWPEVANLTNGAYPEQIPVARVSAHFLPLFGAPVLTGRTFTDAEDRPAGPPVTVISHELWQRQFGGAPDMLGKTVTVGGESRVVVGILAAGFDSEQFDQRPDAWIPFQIDPGTLEKGLCFVTGRLKFGVSVGAGRAQLDTIARNEPAAPELKGEGPSATVVPLRDAMVGDVRSGLLMLVVAVGFVLLIACANVAGLLLVRAIDQRRELAIRAAIGAGRGRIVRQLLTESVALALTGGLLGVLVGTIGIRTLLAAYPGNNDPGLVFSQLASLPRIGHDATAIHMDWRVWLFAVTVSVVTGLLFGLAPAVHAGRADVSTALKAGGTSDARPHAQKMRGLLVMSQMALALTLLVGSGLLIRTSLALLTVNRGFDGHDVLTMRMSVTGTAFDSHMGIEQLTREGLDRLRAIPGVMAASAACCVPLETVWQEPLIVGGRPLAGRWHAFAGWTFVSPGYFEVFRIPLIRGRTFTDRDNGRAPPVIIINEALAHRMWPTGDPLRDQLTIAPGVSPGFERDSPRQIVGIVGDVRDQALNRPARPAMYVPVAQLPSAVTTFMLQQLPLTWMARTSSEPQAFSDQMGRELQTVSGGLPVTSVRSMDQVAARSIGRTRFSMLMMTMFGGLAVLLAAMGIYGLMAFAVKRRTHEIGIRMALGARAPQIRRMLLLEGVWLIVTGIGVGIASAFGLTRLLTSLLFGVTPHDPLVFSIVPVLLAAIALVAAWIPARLATRVDPMVALRCD
jgi:predicted permease